jgi:hypothetical protein
MKNVRRRDFLGQVIGRIGVTASGAAMTRAEGAERPAEQLYTSPLPQTQDKPPQFKKPPELAEGCEHAYIQLGTDPKTPTRHVFYVSKLRAGERKPFRFHGFYDITPILVNNRILIDGTFYYNQSVPITFKASYPQLTILWGRDLFDVRATSNAIEVVGPEDEVCCQIIYKRHNWICLNGVFCVRVEFDPTRFLWWAWGPHTNFSRETPISARELNLKSILEK